MNKKLINLLAIVAIGLLLFQCGPKTKNLREAAYSDTTLTKSTQMGSYNSMNELSMETRTPGDKKFIKTAETKFLVKDVRQASEVIEDLAAKNDGYIVSSDLQNQETDYASVNVSRDSCLISKKIIVQNSLVLKVPNTMLDSLVRKLNKLILFLDYRTVRLDDITFSLLINQKSAERLNDYSRQQKTQAEAKGEKLKDKTLAAEKMLEHQLQADKIQIENQSLEDQVKYCTLTIYIYQKPFYYTEKQVILNTDSFRPGFFTQLYYASLEGWDYLKSFIVFMVSIWWLLVCIVVGIFAYRRLHAWKISNKNH